MPAHRERGNAAWIVIVLAFIALMISYFLMQTGKVPPYDPDTVSERIEPVARLVLTAPTATAVAQKPKDGAMVYRTICLACHNTGVVGAPKIGNKDAWKARIAAGKDALYQSAIFGKNVMPPKGGAPFLSDDEVRAAVDFIVDHAQ